MVSKVIGFDKGMFACQIKKSTVKGKNTRLLFFVNGYLEGFQDAQVLLLAGPRDFKLLSEHKKKHVASSVC